MKSRQDKISTEQQTGSAAVSDIAQNGSEAVLARSILRPIGGVVSAESYVLPANVKNLTLTGTADIYGSGNNSDNILTGNSGNNRLNSGRGNDIVYGHDGNDTINGGEDNDILYGGSGNDLINGERGNDILYGGAGDDTFVFDAKGAQDTIIDNEGGNTVRFVGGIRAEDLSVTVTANETRGRDWKIAVKNTDSVLTIVNQYQGDADHPAIKNFAFDNGTLSLSQFEKITGVNFDTEPFVDTTTIYGTSANDVLNGGSGDDVINGLAGADTMRGWGGNDTYYVDNLKDTVIEAVNGGNDTVISSVSYTASTHVENVTLTGSNHIFGAGNNSDNILTGNSGNNRLNSGRGNDTVYGMDGSDNINGGDGNDYLDGGADNDVINGDAGNDILSGGAGRDILRGGAGNDIYLYGESDTIIDNQGSNTLKFSDGMTVADISLQISDNDEGGKTWQISSRQGSVVIQNQTAADGSIAVDRFVFDNQVYTAQSLSAELEKTGRRGLVIEGKGQYGTTDTLTGGNGNDKIYGNSSRDVIDGGRGNDYMEGSSGADTYIFGRGYGHDTLFDFNFWPDEEFPAHRTNQNTVKFTDGLTLDDLEITVSHGYDTSLVKNIPHFGEYIVVPETEGDTWTIRIKGTDDVLTILNQDALFGAIHTFEFDSGSYNAAQVFQTLGTTEEIIAANRKPITIAGSPDDIYIYGTNGDDINLNRDYRLHRLSEYNGGSRHIYGGDGNDGISLDADDAYDVIFYGGNGNDTVNVGLTKVTFDGGAGDDSISSFRPGEAELIFRAGDGHDTISLNESNGSIHFTGGLTLNDLNITYSDEAAVFTLKTTGDTVTAKYAEYAGAAAGPYSVSQIRFDSGESYKLADLRAAQAKAAQVLDTQDGDTAVSDGLNTVAAKALFADTAFDLSDNAAAQALENGLNRLGEAAAEETRIGAADNAAYGGTNTVAIGLDMQPDYSGVA